ncbi:MAG: metallophosphoesterase, partial [Bdellovibrionales bacterium]|nr:metallophosphoesterase [Bdellovibrionales bacterium]
VRGNHDYFIDEYLQARSLVSFGKQFYLLPDGVVESIPLAYDNSLVVGALGGIEMEANSHYSGQENYANPSLSLEALHRLRHQSSTREIDVLLTHQGPTVEFKGSEQIDNLITSLQPSFHFHGHSHYIMNRVNQIGPTQTFGVANLPYEGPICLDSSLCYSLLRFNLKSRKLERWR